MNRWFLGAYAAFAHFDDMLKTKENEALFREGLLLLPHVRGLELPFYDDLHERDVPELLAWLPSQWEYIITCLPGTMMSLGRDPDYGLASRSEEGRNLALKDLERVRQRVREIHDRHGLKSVRGIEVHSAPRGDQAGAEALRRSIETLLSWDWDGAEILLEHCDAWHKDGAFSKGFMRLQSELSTIKGISVGMSLNWGRSVLEGRRSETIHRHIELANSKLRSLFFSGTAIGDPLYGSWLDNHAAIRLDSTELWEAQGSLLTQEAMEDCLELVRARNLYLGLKVQPFPTSLTLTERLAFLRQQLEAANAAYESV